jgi:hypothetical protein
MNCTECKYYHREADQMDLAASIGFCRKNPPQMFVIHMPPAPTINSGFPHVNDKMVCGEFTRKLEVVGGTAGNA